MLSVKLYCMRLVKGDKMRFLRLLLLLSALSFVSQMQCVVIAQDRAKTPDPKQKASNLTKPKTIKGCYEFGELVWQPDLKLGEDAEFIRPPARIQLLDEHGSTGFEANGYLVRPAPGVDRSIHRASCWVPKGPKAIEIVWTTGFSGLTMNLELESDTLKGKAETFWDFTREHQTASVTAHKVECRK
jgi:hypothetical protein